MAQKASDSRWVTFTAQYDHLWPSRASSKYLPGELRVKNEVADAAIAKGRAKEGRLDGSEATPPKRPSKKRAKAKTLRVSKAKVAGDAKASDAGSNASVAAETVAAADSAGAGSGVDPASG